MAVDLKKIRGLGPDELAKGCVVARNMATGDEREVEIGALG